MTRAEYKLKYRTNPANRTCDCGQPAAVNRGGEWICARCRRLEQARIANENRREVSGLTTTRKTGIEPYTLHL